MPLLRFLSATPRTLALLIAPPGTRYALPDQVAWTLSEAVGGACVASGRATVAPLFIEGLTPNTRYILQTDLGVLELATAPCSGLVDATEFGLDPKAPDNCHALQEAIEATPRGGTLYIPKGRYLTRPIFLKSRMTLHIEDGAKLAAVHDYSNWPKLPARDGQGRALGTWEGLPEPCFAALVTAIDAHGLTVTGRGTLDGGGDRSDWWDWPKGTRDGARRPRTLQLAYCTASQISGVTVCNSPSWTVHPYRCRDLTVAAIRIENPHDSPNTDGLNPESCESVAITGVDFSVGDDCIAIKSGKRRHDVPGALDDHLAPTRDIQITHCRMQRGHGAVVLGSEMSGGIHDVEIRACEFDRTDRGLRVKTRRGRGGTVSGITMHDVVMQDVPTPVAINAFYFCDPDGRDDWVQSRAPAAREASTPVIDDVLVSKVTAHRATLAGAAVLGLPEAPLRRIQFRDVQVSFAPEAQPDAPLMALGVPAIRHRPLWAEHAEIIGDITLLPATQGAH
jgi:polygalacturonase